MCYNSKKGGLYLELIQKNIVALQDVLRRQIMIVDYLHQHVFPIVKHKRYDMNKLKNIIDQQSAICPWHEETQGSFRIYLRQHKLGFTYQDCYCFGCRSGGQIWNVHQKSQEMFHNKRLTYIQSLEDLADLYNIKHEPLYFEPNDIVTNIRNTNIQLEDILNELNKGTTARNTRQEEVLSHYGKYLSLLETQLKILKTKDNKQYVASALEVDYLMSLGLQPEELSLELESIYDRNKLLIDGLYYNIK